jgi:ABC-type uncharacterized transport system permease subunit
MQGSERVASIPIASYRLVVALGEVISEVVGVLGIGAEVSCNRTVVFGEF